MVSRTTALCLRGAIVTTCFFVALKLLLARTELPASQATRTTRLVLEATSLAVTCVGIYARFSTLPAVSEASLPLPAVGFLLQSAAARTSARSPTGGARDNEISVQEVLRSSLKSPAAATLSAVALALHAYWNLSGSKKNNLTRELLLIITIAALEFMIWVTLLPIATCFCGCRAAVAACVSKSRGLRRGHVMFLAALLIATALLVGNPAPAMLLTTGGSDGVVPPDAFLSVGDEPPSIYDLRATITGGNYAYQCVRAPKALPRPILAFLPRRLLNFFTGTEACRGGDQSHRRFSLYHEAEGGATQHSIVVSERCPDTKSVPRVIVEDLESNHLGHLEALDLSPSSEAELAPAATNWIAHVQRTYTNPKTASSFRLTRNNAGHVVRVEVNLESVQRRVPSSPTSADTQALIDELPTADAKEALRMFIASVKDTRGGDLLIVPVSSGAVTVRCDEDDEYHINRLLPAKPTPFTTFPPLPSASIGNRSVAAVPKLAGGVLVLMLDAVSRPEFIRQLPQTTRWLRARRREQLSAKAPAPAAPGIYEFPGLTTSGHSTAKNFVAMMSGHTSDGNIGDADHAHASAYVKANNWFAVTKKHRPEVFTSFIAGYCSDGTGWYLNGTAGTASTGFGTAARDLDTHLFSPWCHRDYGTHEGNFLGYNAITKRCIGKDHVHDMMFALLDSHLRQLSAAPLQVESTVSKNKPFITVAHFAEGHEGSHAVLNQMDASLTAFLEKLTKTGFFSRENALLIVSDHGNHMGPYFEWTEAGQLERTMPAFVALMPHAVVQDFDPPLRENARRLLSPFDIYGTVFDLMGVPHAIPQHFQHDDGHRAVCTGIVVEPLRTMSGRRTALRTLLRDLGPRGSCDAALAQPGCAMDLICEADVAARRSEMRRLFGGAFDKFRLANVTQQRVSQ